jgi:hypothetical protein
MSSYAERMSAYELTSRSAQQRRQKFQNRKKIPFPSGLESKWETRIMRKMDQ